MFFFFNDTATTEIYTYLHTLSLHDALPIYRLASQRRDGLGKQAGVLLVMTLKSHGQVQHRFLQQTAFGAHLVSGNRFKLGAQRRIQDAYIGSAAVLAFCKCIAPGHRSEEHTSELQSLMRISYAVFCLKKKIQNTAIYRSTYISHYYLAKQ